VKIILQETTEAEWLAKQAVKDGKTDPVGKTALHYSIENYYEKSTCTLLQYSNELNFNLDDIRERELVEKCLKRTPRALIQLFDRALKFSQRNVTNMENNNNNTNGSVKEHFEPNNYQSNRERNYEQKELTLAVDFKYLFGRPSSNKESNDYEPLQESELLHKILSLQDPDVKENLLEHPVLHAYLEKKWRKTQLQFLFLRTLHVSSFRPLHSHCCLFLK